MSTHTDPHPRSGTPAEWLEDAAFLGILFVAAVMIATIVVLLIAF